VEIFNTIAVLITLAALFAYLNARFVGLPGNIGLLCISLLASVALVFAGKAGLSFVSGLSGMVRGIDFNMTLMVGMLSFLLFAGALHVDIDDLLERKWKIGSFATIGVVLSGFLIGTLTWLILPLLGLEMDFLHCLLFGAVISPTDPIAVLGVMRKAGAPRELEVKITGESLFNDGVGVVVFIVLIDIVSGGHAPDAGRIAGLFAHEAIGGFVMGLGLGWAGYFLLKSIDNYDVEILITLAVVAGGYAFSLALHLSGPIAIVVAGLMIGNRGRRLAMSDHTREHIDRFWGLLDEILNSVLFVLIGLELLAIPFPVAGIMAGLAAVPVALASRFVSLSVPITVLGIWKTFPKGVIRVLTWGGLRGGISVALALSLPEGAERELIISMTYVVVIFSRIVQGLTLRYVLPEGGNGSGSS
jgi:CPA1 family monovalent cation:H+ antiporter